jgi:hypothetical protein
LDGWSYNSTEKLSLHCSMYLGQNVLYTTTLKGVISYLNIFYFLYNLISQLVRYFTLLNIFYLDKSWIPYCDIICIALTCSVNLILDWPLTINQRLTIDYKSNGWLLSGEGDKYILARQNKRQTQMGPYHKWVASYFVAPGE